MLFGIIERKRKDKQKMVVLYKPTKEGGAPTKLTKDE
jgi:hypothetical protein